MSGPATKRQAVPPRIWPGALAVATLAVGTYVGSLFNGFVFDDVQNILQNPWVSDPSRLGEAFGTHMTGFNPAWAPAYYRPLLHVVLAGCYQVSGYEPWAFHLASILLHASTSACVYLLLVDWLPRDRVCVGALVGAAVFAATPVHVDAVAWSSDLAGVGCAFFFVLALLAGTKRDVPRAVVLLGPAACFLVALGFKEPAVALLPALLVARAVRGDLSSGPSRRETVWQFVWLLLVFCAYLALRTHALGVIVGGDGRTQVGVLEAILTGVALFGVYAGKMVVPLGLSAIHDFGVVRQATEPLFLFGAGAAAAFTLALWRWRANPLWVLGGVIFLMALAPALYLPGVSEGVLAERYLYIPSIGFALMLGAGVSWLWPRIGRWRVAAAVVFAAMVLLMSVGAAMRTAVWHDSLSLWSDAVSKVPRSATAREYLGHALLTAGRPAEAVEQLSLAIELAPGKTEARLNLGLALAAVGRFPAAISEAARVIQERPNSAEAYELMGYALSAVGRIAEAAAAYQRSVALNPTSAKLHNSLGVARAQLGRPELARRHFLEAIRLAPGNRDYARNLGLLEQR